MTKHPNRKITKRQKAVMTLLEAGYTNLEIADRLGVTERAVIYHVSQLRRRFGVKSRAQLTALLVLNRVKARGEQD